MRLHKDEVALRKLQSQWHEDSLLLEGSNEAVAMGYADNPPDEMRRRLHNFLTDAFADPTRDDLGRLWRKWKSDRDALELLRKVHSVLSERIAEEDRLATRSKGLLKPPKRHAKR